LAANLDAHAFGEEPRHTIKDSVVSLDAPSPKVSVVVGYQAVYALACLGKEIDRFISELVLPRSPFRDQAE
jgi:hypothetical protein